MDAPLISVVSVVYNLIQAGRADQFRQMVRSVAAQTYPHIEHIIVDGGSTDDTLALVEDCARPGFRWMSEPDQGIFDAMNKGARMSKGAFINFLNSDDFFHDPSAVQHAVECLTPGIEFTYGTVQRLGEDGRTRPLAPKMRRFLRGMPFNHQTQFLSLDRFWAHGGFDTDLELIADQKLTTDLILSGARGADVGDAGVTFRIGGASGDRGAIAAEKAKVFADVFGPYRVVNAEIWQRAGRQNRLPLGLLHALWRSGVPRDAVLYELRNTLLNALRPG